MIPHVLGEVAAGEPLHVDAVLERFLALAADGLALARRERAEEIVEAAIAGVLPVELLVGALQESELAEEAVFVFGRESDVHAGRAVDAAKLDEPADQSLARIARVPAGPHQQPAAGRRRERYRDLQFRIVVAAGVVIGLGPAVVEHVFAARVALEIAGRGGNERAVGGVRPADAGPASRHEPRPISSSPAPKEMRVTGKGYRGIS